MIIIRTKVDKKFRNLLGRQCQYTLWFTMMDSYQNYFVASRKERVKSIFIGWLNFLKIDQEVEVLVNEETGDYFNVVLPSITRGGLWFDMWRH